MTKTGHFKKSKQQTQKRSNRGQPIPYRTKHSKAERVEPRAVLELKRDAEGCHPLQNNYILP